MLTMAARVAYGLRRVALARLGFSTYKAYLASPLWAGIRSAVLSRSPICVGCGGRATQVHHARYHLADLRGSCLTHLLPVCKGCHHHAEFTRWGTKVAPRAATKRLRARAARPQKPQPWATFFAAAEAMQHYLEREGSAEARALVDQFVTARAALPAKKTPKNTKSC